MKIDRRTLLTAMIPAASAACSVSSSPRSSSSPRAPSASPTRSVSARSPSMKRHIVIMFDGFGLDYLANSEMPTLRRWVRDGLFAEVDAVMPTVTNANNASICCNAWPREHGITANSYLDEATGEERFMESANLLLAPTVFERIASKGIRSALFTSKKKTAYLLGRGAEWVVAAEQPAGELVARFGPAPSIYSWEINEWLGRVAIDTLETRPELGCLYFHTTDYPMHMWEPEHATSKRHLARMDAIFAEMERKAPDATFYLTADHGMNFKTRAWDLERVLRAGGVVARVISAERDRYPKHHRGLGGTAWVYLQRSDDAMKVERLLRDCTGIEAILSRARAAERYRLMPNRIGHLVVTADKTTVFGALETESSALPAEYRSHGSRYEQRIPLVLHPIPRGARKEQYTANVDALATLAR